jgi:hypothetical protein
VVNIVGVTASAIKNQALFALGFVDEIDFTSLTDTTVKKVNRVYDTCLVNVLSSYRWGFAIKRVKLGQTQTSVFTGAITDIITSTISLKNGHTVTLTTTDTLPAGLATGTTYYVIDSSGVTCKLSLTVGGTAVNITDTGTGTHTLVYQDRMEADDTYKYKYNYTLPSDLLTYNASYHDPEYKSPIRYFETNNVYLNTDETTAYLMYTALVDETVFPQYFINYFQYKLALELCFNLTGDTELVKLLAEQETRAFIRAKSIDARQANVRTIKSSPFVTVRS